MISWPQGHYYIGSSVDLDNRKRQHSQALSRNDHGNPHMQAVFNKYGPGRFEVLELCPPEDVQDIEQEHLDREFEEGSDLFLNINKRADRLNYDDRWLAKCVAAARSRTDSWRKNQAEGVRRALAKPFRIIFPDGSIEEWLTCQEAADRHARSVKSVNNYLRGKQDPAKAKPGNPLRGCKFEYI